jgi:hypothetical protein
MDLLKKKFLNSNFILKQCSTKINNSITTNITKARFNPTNIKLEKGFSLLNYATLKG